MIWNREKRQLFDLEKNFAVITRKTERRTPTVCPKCLGILVHSLTYLQYKKFWEYILDNKKKSWV